MKRQFQNIIFDLGGVLLNINYQNTIEAFKTLGVKDFDEVYSQVRQTNLFDLLETGSIKEREFYDGIRKLSGINISDQDISDAWNAMLLSFPAERFDFLRKVGAKYNTYLLSNTNSIHFAAFNRIIDQENNVSNLSEYFDKTFYSHLLGRRKPHPETFLHVLDIVDARPEDTLFIDDSIQHVKGAELTGITGVWLDIRKENVVDKLDFLLA